MTEIFLDLHNCPFRVDMELLIYVDSPVPLLCIDEASELCEVNTNYIMIWFIEQLNQYWLAEEILYKKSCVHIL